MTSPDRSGRDGDPAHAGEPITSTRQGVCVRDVKRGNGMPVRHTARLDRILWPLHRWVWSDFDRRVRKLIAFSKVEGDGGRDILRAAELTPDPLLRRLYLEHAIDELRHADLFRHRGAALLQLRAANTTALFNTN